MVRDWLIAIFLGFTAAKYFSRCGFRPFLAVRFDLVVEELEMPAQVRADDVRLERLAVARIAEEECIAVAVSTRDPVAAEKLDGRIGRVLPAHDHPQVDAVATHDRLQQLAHLPGLDAPFALDAAANELGREGRRLLRGGGGRCQCAQDDERGEESHVEAGG